LATAEGFDLGLDVGDHGRPSHREGIHDYAHYNFCSLVTVLEEPSWKSEGRVRVLDESVQRTSVEEETAGREGRNS
jgi:hypothetical protein